MRKFLSILILVMLTSSLLAGDDLFKPKTTIGGYGEIHYNSILSKGADDPQTLDFHRFILFFNHSFTKHWSFGSEIELEHNFVKDGHGELELEQAHITYRHSSLFSFRVGVVIPSVGIINEYHEPPLFLSVERPLYSKKIIPTTWFGNGLSLFGSIKNFEYKLTLFEGLDGSRISAGSGIRDARMKGYKSSFKSPLYNISLNYTGIPGLRLGGSFVYNNSIVSNSVKNSVSLWEVHARYDANNLMAVFEYGAIAYGSPGLVTGGAEKAYGFYFDLGYDVISFFGRSKMKLMPWVRYSQYNTASKTVAGGISEKENFYKIWRVGLSFKPIRQIVFKADYGEVVKQSDNSKVRELNLGVGYMF